MRIPNDSDSGLRPCILYRKYFVGSPEYARVKPEDVLAHMRDCKKGCADFYLAVSLLVMPEPITQLVMPGKEACSTCPPDSRATALDSQDPGRHCVPEQVLKDEQPAPGSYAFHLLVCEACRQRQLRIICETQRARYEATAGSFKKSA